MNIDFSIGRGIHLRAVVLFAISFSTGLMFSCGSRQAEQTDSVSDTSKQSVDTLQAISDPLVSHIYTADPSAHVLMIGFISIHLMILTREFRRMTSVHILT